MITNKIIRYIVLAIFPLLAYGQENENVWDENEILQYGFIYPLNRSFGLENKEITSIEELNKQIKEFFIPAELYFNAYNDLEIDSAIKKSDTIFYVNYRLGGKQLKSYSLFKSGFYENNYLKNVKLKTATLIIPGSHENQSIEVFNGTGYHLNIANDVANLGDVFIATKPNQDFLALHRGGSKLDYTFLVNYMLNKGGSYSVSYLINTLATVKYLKTVYDRVFVLGLSQGGLAALLNSIQSSPDAAVIASGFTITRDLFEWSGFDQIIIPNSINIISNESIRETISKQHTNYFFSWGTNEIGTYKLEAENKYTYKYFSDLKNVECNFHNQGHSYPQPFTNNFLSKIPFASIDIELTKVECGQDIYIKPVSLSSHNITTYKWYRNDTLLNTSHNILLNTPNEILMLSIGGVYKLVVKTDEAKIFETRKIFVDPIHFERKLYADKSLILAPKGFNSYKWYLDDTLLDNEYEDNLIIKKEGKYTCCLTNDLGNFISNEISVNQDYPFIVKDLEVLHLYPNPNNGNFNIVLTSSDIMSDNVDILIYNELGQKVYENKILPDGKFPGFEVNVNSLKKGRYFIKAITSNKAFVKSVIILN